MNDLPASRQERRENPDPYELEKPIPLAVMLLVATMVIFGMFYILAASPDNAVELGDNRTPADLAARPAQAKAGAGGADGAAVFAARCAACHQASGQGVPGVFPPLAGSEWVQGDEARLAKILLHGVQGPITVKGTRYDGAMPGFKSQLDDASIAAVATYVRAQWGNAAPAVGVAAIAGAREATTTRTTPWNGDADLGAK